MVLLTMVLTKYALIESFIKQSYLSNFKFSVLTFTILCITASGYIINDIFDVEVDKTNKPNKVYIDTNIPKKKALIAYYLLIFLGLVLGLYLSFNSKTPCIYFIFIFAIIGLYFYSKILKRKVLVGNIIVSLLIAFSILLVVIFDLINFNKGIEVVTPLIAIFFYISFSFLTTFIREIIKDIEDIDDDYKLGIKTLPIIIGRKRTNRIAFGFSSILLLFIIGILKQYLIQYPIFLSYSVIFILLPLGYFMYKLWNAKSKKQYSLLSKFMKLIMFFGILSMLFFLKLN